MATACSATLRLLAPGVMTTGMPSSVATDDLQVGAVFNGMCIALCNAHDQRIRVLHIVQIIIGIGIIFCNDLHLTIGICLELFDAFRADGLCHNKFHK